MVVLAKWQDAPFFLNLATDIITGMLKGYPAFTFLVRSGAYLIIRVVGTFFP
jgi:hypothetical protein